MVRGGEGGIGRRVRGGDKWRGGEGGIRLIVRGGEGCIGSRMRGGEREDIEEGMRRERGETETI